ncbi:BQ2448_5864 [Microbotryum intermedium]|uniref:BQ2448_5864 protein n=1 Tax=Microbotryum intermedium TaxID=269621 RepID=A0A238F7R7_9BASI|nr:BQ2448_5864 [Microbotryum intermedium]
MTTAQRPVLIAADVEPLLPRGPNGSASTLTPSSSEVDAETMSPHSSPSPSPSPSATTYLSHSLLSAGWAGPLAQVGERFDSRAGDECACHRWDVAGVDDDVAHQLTATHVGGKQQTARLTNQFTRGSKPPQIGLLVSTLTTWKVLYDHPAGKQLLALLPLRCAGLLADSSVLRPAWARWCIHPGLFSYHPALQSLAILFFAEGVLLLQPPPSNNSVKRKGLQLHQVFQYTALPLILAGASAIIYNKSIHTAQHATTWHARFGLATLALILLQIVFGAVVVYSPLVQVFGGEGKAKRLWKMSGYATLTLLLLTPLLALESTWVQSNSSSFERVLIGSGLGLAGLGVFLRIQKSKLGL